jgi:hypothetical protein
MVNYQFSYILVMQIVGARPIFANELKSCSDYAAEFNEKLRVYLSNSSFNWIILSWSSQICIFIFNHLSSG